MGVKARQRPGSAITRLGGLVAIVGPSCHYWGPRPRFRKIRRSTVESDALPSRTRWKLPSSTQTLILVCFVAALSYLAPALESALIAHPPTVWPLWPSWALLVPIL